MGILILFSLAKIAIVLLFLVTTAGVLTWAERRQSAMIQDRIGPNRAVIRVPSLVAKVVVGGVGVGLAGAVVGGFYAIRRAGPAQLDNAFGLTEMAILASWIGVVMMERAAERTENARGLLRTLARIRDPRIIFYGGLLLHALALAAWLSLPRHFSLAMYAGREPMPAPSTAAEFLLRSGFLVGPAWLALVLAALGLWAAIKIPSGGIGLRAAGLLHLVADGAKMAFKEDFVPPGGDKLLHALGPIVALFPALVTFAVVPFGDVLCLHTTPSESLWTELASLRIEALVPRSGVCSEDGVPLQIASLNVGILYMFALAGTGIVGAALAGYSSNNKFSLLGALRASSQMVSYEVAMGMTLVGAFMVYGTVRLEDMVRWQANHAWGIFVQPFAFVLFLAAANAEQKRIPFDAPEGESEIVAGYFVEYSGMKWAMFYLGEYIEIVVSSALLATIFFGGWALPFVHRDGISITFGERTFFTYALEHWAVVLLGVLAFFSKVLLLCWAQLFIRWTLPRFRYDQIMNVSWRILLPCAMVNVLATGAVLLVVDQAGPSAEAVLSFVADLTHAVVALAGFLAVLLVVSGMLKPAPKRKPVTSSSSALAREKGGTTMSPMQA